VFFFASKVYWILASPILLLLVIALLGTLMSFGAGWVRAAAKAAAALSLLVLTAAAATPLGLWLVRPLEDRFPPPPDDMPAPDGIIVLGGAVNGAVSTARGQPVFEEGERVVEAVLLAKRYPSARIIFTGGSGSLFRETSTEAAEAKKLMTQLGVDPARVTLEEKSRNTEENARFTAALIHPEPSDRWLLVTSAFHMTRSMGVFEAAGFHVVAYPVAYRTPGPGRDLPWDSSPANNLRVFETALREWIGLAAYWATGRIDSLFPGPPGVAMSSGERLTPGRLD